MSAHSITPQSRHPGSLLPPGKTQSVKVSLSPLTFLTLKSHTSVLILAKSFFSTSQFISCFQQNVHSFLRILCWPSASVCWAKFNLKFQLLVQEAQNKNLRIIQVGWHQGNLTSCHCLGQWSGKIVLLKFSSFRIFKTTDDKVEIEWFNVWRNLKTFFF